MAVEAGLERGRIASLQARIERPVLFRAKCLALLLALDDYPQRHRLDPSGADSTLDGDVPSDRFALAVGVGRQVDVVGLLGLRLDFLEHLRLAGDDVVLGLEVVVDGNPERALGQIHHMADRGDDLEVGTQITLDRFRLGR